jgi:hypothetical protein
MHPKLTTATTQMGIVHRRQHRKLSKKAPVITGPTIMPTIIRLQPAEYTIDPAKCKIHRFAARQYVDPTRGLQKSGRQIYKTHTPAPRQSTVRPTHIDFVGTRRPSIMTLFNCVQLCKNLQTVRTNTNDEQFTRLYSVSAWPGPEAAASKITR